MRHAGAPAGAARGQGRADTRAGAAEGADGAQERPGAALSAERLWAVMAALAPMADLASAAGLRALPAAPRDGQTGGGDPQAWVDALHDRGEADRARTAWQRCTRCPGHTRPALEWLADRGHSRPDVVTAAQLYAGERAPWALRADVERAGLARRAADAAVSRASPGKRRPRTVVTVELARARDLATQAAAEERRAVAALVDWGVGELGAAVTAWEMAGQTVEVAA